MIFPVRERPEVRFCVVMRTLPLFVLVPLALSSFFLAGCSSRSRCCGPRGAYAQRARPAPAASAPKATKPAPALASRLYEASSGTDATLAESAADWGEVDLVAFGEMHGDLVGAAAQLELLQILAGQARPIALAMEFFERDTQADLDAYLAGTLEKEAYLKQTKRNKAYAATHGPLVDFCKERGIPVIAANAPRRLVTAYRKSDQDYEAYLEGLSEEDRALLPEETEVIEDEYYERFVGMMGEERGVPYFRSQALWDDSMAEAMVDFRAEHPNHRVLFIVGGFHVTAGLGTLTKYRNRRGKDELRIVLMTASRDPQLKPEEDEIGKADLILKVPAPKRRHGSRMPKKGMKKAAPKGGPTS